MTLDNPYSQLRPIEGEPDSCIVEVAASQVIFSFNVSRLYLSRRKLDSNLSVSWRATKGLDARDVGLPMGTLAPTHVDWRSNTSIDQQRKRMQDYFDPHKAFDYPWMQILQWAAERVDQFIREAGELQSAEHVPIVAPDYIVHPIWPASVRPTVWFGQGETMKGQISLGSAVAACYGWNFAGLRTKDLRRGIVLVDYEDDFSEFSRRVSRTVNAKDALPPPNLRRFDPKGRPFVEIADQLKAKIQADGGADAIMVDSAIPACAGDVNEPEPVGGFFSALSWIGLPSLVIAHEVKSGDGEHPFGSQVWRTAAAMNVNFQAGEEAQKTTEGNWCRDVLLRCTKANNVRRFSPLAFRVTFTDDEAPDYGALPEEGDRPLARTWIAQIAPGEVSPDLHKKLPYRDQIRAFLTGGSYSIAEVSEGTGIAAKTVGETLSRFPQIFQGTGGGRGRGNAAQWRVISDTG